MFEVVFTNPRTHMDLVTNCSEISLVVFLENIVNEMSKDGYFLSELKRLY